MNKLRKVYQVGVDCLMYSTMDARSTKHPSLAVIAQVHDGELRVILLYGRSEKLRNSIRVLFFAGQLAFFLQRFDSENSPLV
jgi:hypothetical protein